MDLHVPGRLEPFERATVRFEKHRNRVGFQITVLRAQDRLFVVGGHMRRLVVDERTGLGACQGNLHLLGRLVQSQELDAGLDVAGRRQGAGLVIDGQ